MSAPTLLHHLLEPNMMKPERVALIDGQRQLDYGSLIERTTDCAGALQANGLQRGDRVAIFLPKSIEECWAIFGSSLAGGVFVPINPLLRVPQIRHILHDSEPRIIVTNDAFVPIVSKALEGIEGITILLVEDIPKCGASPRDTLSIGEDLAAILYTSGSTGRPKGVMLSHRNLLAGTRIVRNYLGIGPEDRILSILPFSFDYGLNQLLTAMEQGATIILLTFRFGNEIVQSIISNQITGLAGVPTLWAILTKATPLLKPGTLPSLRYITNSGGAVPTETVLQLRKLLDKTDIYLMYGLTESFRSTFLPPKELEKRPGSIGRAIPECEVFAVTSEGQRTKPGEPGILVHRGPTVSLGYWRKFEETTKVLRPNPLRPVDEGGELVCYSGDLVVEDEEGYFSFVGRRDTMIKSAGYRISPSEVEEAVMATGAFRQVAVLGLPDPTVGQNVHAVAVALSPNIELSEILREVSDVLPAYMVPRKIELVEMLPTTANGKVDYPALMLERQT